MKKPLQYITTILLMLLVVSHINAQVLARGSELKLISDDFMFTEGPAKSIGGHIFFTDQPNDQILKWDVEKEELSTFLKPAGRSNGLYFDNDGYLIACADENNQMWRIDMQGNHTVLIDSLDGQLLNAPNDLWIDDEGGIYFTDPLYKRTWWTRADDSFLDQQNVYYFAPSGEITMVVDDYVRPNGIIGDIKKNKLYISDIGDDRIWVYDIVSPGKVSNKRLFASMGSDGMTMDKKRHVYLTNKEGVYVYNQEGEQVDLIKVPKSWTANVTIGGKKNKTLYITAKEGFYSIDLKNKGLY